MINNINKINKINSLNKIIASCILLAFSVASHASTEVRRLLPVNAVTYELVSGKGGRMVQEWTPKYNKNIKCVYIGGMRASGVACYPIKHTSTPLK